MDGIKAMKQEFAVIGLGRFGGAICEELSREGMNVLAVDIDEQRVNAFKNIASHAVIADATDEEALKAIGIQNIDHVIVAIGDNIQASILTTVVLTELGIKRITVKAQNDYHEKILNKIGADVVVHPERDMGRRLAQSLISSNIIDYIELSDEHRIVEVKAGKKLYGKNLKELNIRARYGINVVAIKRGSQMIISPKAEETIAENDILIIIGSNDDFTRFEKHYIFE